MRLKLRARRQKKLLLLTKALRNLLPILRGVLHSCRSKFDNGKEKEKVLVTPSELATRRKCFKCYGRRIMHLNVLVRMCSLPSNVLSWMRNENCITLLHMSEMKKSMMSMMRIFLQRMILTRWWFENSCLVNLKLSNNFSTVDAI